LYSPGRLTQVQQESPEFDLTSRIKNCLTFLEEPANVAISFIEAHRSRSGRKTPSAPPARYPQSRRIERCKPDPLAVALRRF
jgi:hypothetical protein